MPDVRERHARAVRTLLPAIRGNRELAARMAQSPRRNPDEERVSRALEDLGKVTPRSYDRAARWAREHGAALGVSGRSAAVRLREAVLEKFSWANAPARPRRWDDLHRISEGRRDQQAEILVGQLLRELSLASGEESGGENPGISANLRGGLVFWDFQHPERPDETK